VNTKGQIAKIRLTIEKAAGRATNVITKIKLLSKYAKIDLTYSKIAAEQAERRNQVLEGRRKEAEMKANEEKIMKNYRDAKKIVMDELGDLYSHNEKHRCFSKEMALLMKKEVPYCTHIIRGKKIVCIRCYDILIRLQKPPIHEFGCLTAKCGSMKSHYNLRKLEKCDCFTRYLPYRYTRRMQSYWTLLLILKFR